MKNPPQLRVYLDTCCLNRPLDDALQERIRLEAEAVRMILRLIETDQLAWVTSEVLAFEVDQNPDSDRRNMIMSAIQGADTSVEMNESLVLAAQRYEKIGFAPMDALHLASAKTGGAQVFLTVDDALLRKARKAHNRVMMRVMNPLEWVGDLE